LIGREAAVWTGAIVVAIGCSLATSHVERAAVGAIVRGQVRAVETLAGLRGDDGEDRASSRLPVAVLQEGGPPWVGEDAVAALGADPVLEPARGPHMLVVEVVHEASAWAVSVRLHRSGWGLRTPRPARVHVAPWVATASAIAGAGVARKSGRWLWGVLAAAALAQALAAALPWPEGLPAHSLVDAWRDGPLARTVVDSARALPDASTPILVGVAVLCAMLAFFDHRRTRSRGVAAIGVGLGGLVAALAWLEAGLRTALAAWLAAPVGIIGGLALVSTWWLALRRRAGASRTA
jgi:hypothetical protein